MALQSSKIWGGGGVFFFFFKAGLLTVVTNANGWNGRQGKREAVNGEPMGTIEASAILASSSASCSLFFGLIAHDPDTRSYPHRVVAAHALRNQRVIIELCVPVSCVVVVCCCCCCCCCCCYYCVPQLNTDAC